MSTAAQLATQDVSAIQQGLKRLTGDDRFALRDALETHPADILSAFAAFRAGELPTREAIGAYTDAFLAALGR